MSDEEYDEHQEEEMKKALLRCIQQAEARVALQRKQIAETEGLIFLGKGELNGAFGELEMLLDVFKIEMVEGEGRDERKNRNKRRDSDNGAFDNDFD